MKKVFSLKKKICFIFSHIYIKAKDNFRVLRNQMDPECKYVLGNWPHGAWHESKITVRFWIVTILLAAATIITLKIR